MQSRCIIRTPPLAVAIYGIDRAYFSVQGYQLTQGRGFLEGDYEKCRKVAILDEKAVSSLFP